MFGQSISRILNSPLLPLVCLMIVSLACGQGTPTGTPVLTSSTPSAPTAPVAVPARMNRLNSIPSQAVKVIPANDPYPPVAALGWSSPEPLGLPVNTAGGEDSPFLTPDGESLYFFFTPDVNVPAEEQLVDGVTGIWVSQRGIGGWREPERVQLANTGELHLDGCPFVHENWMVFCSVREGNVGEIDLYTADWQNGEWTGWLNWGKRINVVYDVGEAHVNKEGNLLFFGADRPGGLGGRDLWVSEFRDRVWEKPVNLGSPVNSAGNEDRPFLSYNEHVLWFDGDSRQGHPGPAIFRSVRQPDGSWGEPEEVVSTFAAEPTLTADGRTLFFVHHYFNQDMSRMIEADIYVTRLLEP